MSWRALSLLWLLTVTVAADEKSGTVQSSRLYSAPDSAAAGGIRGRLVLPNAPLRGAFAMLTHNPRQLYRAELLGDGKEFLFRGLAVGKYDLMLLYEDGFYEGFALTREDDTLTTQDRAHIQATIGRATPFFDTKEIHRCAGTTGREGKARCVLQELRTKTILTQAATEIKNSQIRSLKLAWLEDVGATGWQLVNTREIVRQEVGPRDRKGVLPHHFNPQLSKIRVTDQIKDLGNLNLHQVETN